MDSLLNPQEQDMKESNDIQIDFVGVGATRSGTTWLFHCLEQHPKVCTSHIKEVPFFNNEDNYSKGVSYYRDYFQHCMRGKLSGEFNPNYLHDPAVPERIKKTIPEAKIIISLRDPIEALYSRYRFMKHRGMHASKDFQEFILHNKKFVKERLYFHHTKKFFQQFPQDKIHVIIYNDIEKNPTSVINNLYSFLKINPSIKPDALDEKIHTSEPHWSLAFFRPFYVLFDHLRQHTLGKKLINFVSKSYFRKIFEDAFYKKKNRVQNQEKYKEKIEPQLLTALYNFYEDDIQKLEKLLNKDLTHWKQ